MNRSIVVFVFPMAVLCFSFLFQSFIYGAYAFGSFLGVAAGALLLAAFSRRMKVKPGIGAFIISAFVMFGASFCLVQLFPLATIRDLGDLMMPYVNAAVMTIIYLAVSLIVTALPIHNRSIK